MLVSGIVSRHPICGALDFSDRSPDCAWVHSVAESLGIPYSEGSPFAVSVRPRRPNAPTGGFPPKLTIAADLKLYRRGDLATALGVPESDCTDYELVLSAFEKWGSECPRHLLGEFCFAIQDDPARRLFLCVDHMGFRPLYYWQSGTRIVFADDPRRVVAALGVPRILNRKKLAGMAIPNGLDLYHDETFHAAVLSLPPGTSLTVDRRGVSRSVYWKPELRPELVPHREDEAFEALRELLTRAVGDRMEGHDSVAALLSGGLDSSSVTAIAARCLEKESRAGRIVFRAARAGSWGPQGRA